MWVGKLKPSLIIRRLEVGGILDPLVHQGPDSLIRKGDAGVGYIGENLDLSVSLQCPLYTQRSSYSAQVANKVENQDPFLAVTQTQPATELLHENSPTVRNACEAENIDVWDVNALVQDVD